MRALVIGIVLLMASSAAADEITIRASVEPATAAVGEQVVLTVQVDGKFRRSSEPELPALPDFDVFQAGTSQSFSFVNGQARSSLTFTYVLAPRKEGTFRIEPIRFSDGSKQYTADPVTVEVVAGSGGVVAPRSGAAPSTQPRGQTPGQEESIFVAASVDHDTVYVNEQVTWTLGYYTDGRVELLRSPNYSPPPAEGFWVEDLPPQNKYYQDFHGRQYLVSEIKRGFFPTAPGTYTIGPARVDIVIDDVRSRGSLDDFFNRGLRGGFGQPRTLETEPMRIVALPLPAAGKPADFTGAVARDLTVSIAADKQTVRVGEPINVSVEINAVGNVQTLVAPKLTGLDMCKVYESGSTMDNFKKDYVVSGRRRFDFVVVPQVEGKFAIPPVRMSYFDPGARAYQVAQSVAVPVDVLPGTAEAGPRVIYAGGGDDLKVINRDVRFIHAPPAALAPAQPPLHTSPVFLSLQAIPLLAVGASLLIERRRRRLRDDAGYARSSRALRDAERKLSDAGRLFRSGQAEDAYGRVHAAIVGYVADKLNVPAAGVAADSVEAFLRGRGAPDAVVDTTLRALRACDAARYAAGAADPAAGPALVESVRGVLASAEKELR